MKSLTELIEDEEPAIELIKAWVQEAKNDVIVLPPSNNREEALLKTQVTTHSVLGALVYDTGGILVNHGLLRFPGSGHPSFQRILPGWNESLSQEGLYFVGDDAVGGFFALNGGAFGNDTGKVYYWPPDSLEWEPMDLQFSEFLNWSMIGDLKKFYDGILWGGWQSEINEAGTDKCINFYPPLWAKEGSPEGSMRAPVPVKEAFDVKLEFIRQLSEKT